MNLLQQVQTKRLSPGAILASRYEIVRPLGSGSQGTTYLARDRALGRTRVVLKIIHPDRVASDDARRAIREQFAKTRTLAHPQICRRFDLLQLDDMLWVLTGEYVSGCSLAELQKSLTTSELTEPEILIIIGQIAKALAYIHRSGLIHGNLHPNNILISRSGEVKISDFQLWSGTPDKTLFTRSRTFLGVPRYYSPEQLRGETEKIESDVFTLGLIAAELILGGRKAIKSSLIQDYSAQLNVSLSDFNYGTDSISSELATVLEASINQEPEHRLREVAPFINCIERELQRVGPECSERKINVNRLGFNALTHRDIGNYQPIRIILLLLLGFGVLSSFAQENVRSRVITLLLTIERDSQRSFTPLYDWLHLPNISTRNPNALTAAMDYPGDWLFKGVLASYPRLNSQIAPTALLHYLLFDSPSTQSFSLVEKTQIIQLLSKHGYYTKDYPEEHALLQKMLSLRNSSILAIVANLQPHLLIERDLEGRTIFDLTAAMNDASTLDDLLMRFPLGCRLDNSTGRGPIHWAALHGATDALHVLITHQCLSFLPDSTGANPLHLALEHLNEEKLQSTIAVIQAAAQSQQFPSSKLIDSKALSLAKQRNISEFPLTLSAESTR